MTIPPHEHDPRQTEDFDAASGTQGLPLARDRIAQAYLGLWGSAETREQARRRIDWLASHVTGKRVLDVGCSEGILAILLAREGFEVIGVDVNADALQYAGELLVQENEFVRQRVTLVHADLETAHLEPASFDTVILGEVIEHLLHPARIVERSFELLKPYGIFLLTTPFGWFPVPDHRQTFTISHVVEMLKPYCIPLSIGINDKFICFAGKKEVPEPDSWKQYDEAVLLDIVEKGAIEAQRTLRGEITELSTGKRQLRAALQSRIDTLKVEKDELRAHGKDLQARLKDMERQLEQTSRALQNAQNQHETLQNDVRVLENERDEFAAALERMRAENRDLLAEQKAFEQKVSKLETANQLRDSALKTLQADLASLTGKHSILQSQFESEQQDRQQADFDYHRATGQLVVIRNSFSYRLGNAFASAIVRPGKNTLALPYRLGKLLVRAAINRLRPVTRSIFTIRCILPNGIDKVLYLFHNRHHYFIMKQRELVFYVPSEDCAYITTNDTFLFSKTPSWNYLYLQPNTTYLLSGTVAISGNVVLLLIEYGHNGKVATHRLELSSNRLSFKFRTHKRHASLAIAFRVTGHGSISMEPLSWSIQNASVSGTKSVDISTSSTLLKQNTSILGWPDSFDKNEKPLIIGIMDEFTAACFSKDVNLIQPRPDNWYGLAEKFLPELIFIESAWKGNFGSWEYRVGEYSNKPGNEVAELAAYGRKKNIPVVFWNKEDPVHHNKFIKTACLADVIFTTDANMIASYQQKTGKQKVFSLPFAAQAGLHKPCSLINRAPKVCFAGSWYVGRHAARGDAMQWLLSAAKPLGLDIYDRNYGTGLFPFPDEYADLIKGALPYEALCRQYGRYRVFLNVNSVTDSPTMFSRRVFELLACGTPVVSTYARGIEELLGTEAVWLVEGNTEAKKAIETLLSDDHEWRRRSLSGIRKVFTQHTYQHRLKYIFDQIGQEYPFLVPKVALMAKAATAAQMEHLKDFANTQSWSGFVLFVRPPLGFHESRLPSTIKTVDDDFFEAPSLSEALTNFDYAGTLDPSATYGVHFLQDLVNATCYAPEANTLGKSIRSDEFSFHRPVHPSACIHKTPFLSANLHALFSPDILEGPDIFCIDSAEFNPPLHSANHRDVS